MKLLVLGGTRFLGRHVVQQALGAGHRVTLFHRGQSNAALFPQAEHCIGDRNGDLGVLREGRWDAVIDTSAYVPRQVRTVAVSSGSRCSQIAASPMRCLRRSKRSCVFSTSVT